MKNRISVGVLIFKNNKILLVKHVHPKTGFAWWVPPGGGVMGTETIFEAAEREVLEETGTKVKLDKIAYVRQFIYKEQEENNINLYVTSSGAEGIETIQNVKGKGLDEHYIKELKYFSKEELQKETVFPEILKGEMWQDYKKGFPCIRFIGVETDR
jgi:8-oxo-dGTP pyrophosphatase MutT (NUDIX family)